MKQFHGYELTFGSLAAAGSSTANFQVENAYDFYWTKSAAFVYDANGLGVSELQRPNLEVTLQQGSSAANLTNQATALENLFGSARVPFILPVPHKIQGGATLNVTVKNQHASVTYSARLCFIGIFVPAGMPLVEFQRRARRAA